MRKTKESDRGENATQYFNDMLALKARLVDECGLDGLSAVDVFYRYIKEMRVGSVGGHMYLLGLSHPPKYSLSVDMSTTLLWSGMRPVPELIKEELNLGANLKDFLCDYEYRRSLASRRLLK